MNLNLENNVRVLPAPAYIFLVMNWVVSGGVLLLPFGESLSLQVKILLLSPAILLSLFVIVMNPKEGYSFWPILITLLVTQTGFQATIMGITTSVLEVILVILLVVLFIYGRNHEYFIGSDFSIPGQNWFFVFVIISFIYLVITIVLGTSWTLAIVEFKGFILYPLIAFVFLAGIQSENLLRTIFVILIIWYLFVASRGILGFRQDIIDNSLQLYRENGQYAPINLYGITLMVVALMLLGIVVYIKRRYIQIAFIMIGGWLMIGAITSVSRTAMVIFFVGLSFLVLTQWKGRWWGILIILISLMVVFLFPNQVTDRLFQVSDSSSIRRIYYLESGLRTLQYSYGLGVGWGNGYLYNPSIGLYSSNYIPWYHNDYLNLAVQIGIPGLFIYLGFWMKVLMESIKRLRENISTIYTPYILGSLLALVGLLSGAFFEHVLWRSDIAGLLGLMLGVLIVSMKLDQEVREAK